MTGAVLNALNTRLDAASISFQLNHGEAKVLITDREFAPTIKAALAAVDRKLLIIDVDDPVYDGAGERIGALDYEVFLAQGNADYAWNLPADEWDAIALNYTSGTTGNPKASFTRIAALTRTPCPMCWCGQCRTIRFTCGHCRCFTATAGAFHGRLPRWPAPVCLRKVEAQAIFDAIREHKVTHYCGAPIVHSLLISAPDEMKQGITHKVHAMVAAAAPPASMIEGMDRMGFDLTHVYGLTEVYGPATVCAKQPEWAELDVGERAMKNSRQGVRYTLEEAVAVLDPDSMQAVPADGETIGEVMFRGNIMMKGYLKNEAATDEAFRGGWFHTGDLAVVHPDGYLRIKDRSKDIIISGGENISSIEVEDAL